MTTPIPYPTLGGFRLEAAVRVCTDQSWNFTLTLFRHFWRGCANSYGLTPLLHSLI
jgi:hypothetical protein